MLRLQGKALFRASTLLAAAGFLLFGYDQVYAHNCVADVHTNTSIVGCHVWHST